MKKDWILIGAVLFSALLLWIGFSRFAPGAGDVVISAEGKEILRCSLTKDQVLTLPHHGVKIENQSVRVIRSDCGGQDCVKTPPVSRGGQAIVCLPYRLSIRIVSGNALDSITY